MSLVAMLILGVVPLNDAAIGSCTMIEQNWFYDEKGRLVFEQLLFWDWNEKKQDYVCVAFDIVKKPEQRPWRDWGRGGWCCVFVKDGFVHDVRAREFRETWTQVDPELIARETLPKEHRRPLFPSRR